MLLSSQPTVLSGSRRCHAQLAARTRAEQRRTAPARRAPAFALQHSRSVRSWFQSPTSSIQDTHPQQLEGEHYEDIVEQLAQRAVQLHGTLSKTTGQPRVLIGIAGAPGSGKSTLSQLVCSRINALHAEGSAGDDVAAAIKAAAAAAIVPMDGFHLYRHQLNKMPDPEEAHARRGAPWTFDAAAFVACVQDVREGGEVLLPSFDHAVGDPIEGDLRVLESTHIVLVEGNYLLIPDEPWHQLRDLFDEAWFVDCPVDVAMSRVLQRQVSNGDDEAYARARVDNNDLKNAVLVTNSKHVADVLVPSSVPFRRPA